MLSALRRKGREAKNCNAYTEIQHIRYERIIFSQSHAVNNGIQKPQERASTQERRGKHASGKTGKCPGYPVQRRGPQRSGTEAIPRPRFNFRTPNLVGATVKWIIEFIEAKFVFQTKSCNWVLDTRRMFDLLYIVSCGREEKRRTVMKLMMTAVELRENLSSQTLIL